MPPLVKLSSIFSVCPSAVFPSTPARARMRYASSFAKRRWHFTPAANECNEGPFKCSRNRRNARFFQYPLGYCTPIIFHAGTNLLLKLPNRSVLNYWFIAILVISYFGMARCMRRKNAMTNGGTELRQRSASFLQYCLKSISHSYRWNFNFITSA